MVDPKLATGDGALGFWKALPQVYPTTREQRCWVHKTANVLDKLPKRLQPEAKEKIHAIWMAATRADANQAFDLFVATYEAKYPKATACLSKDRDVLLTFYDFPAEHWIHLRTTNPIRMHVRHGPLAASPHERQRQPTGAPDDGLQADAIRTETLAAAERRRATARRDSRNPIRRRNQTPTSRRLKFAIHNI